MKRNSISAGDKDSFLLGRIVTGDEKWGFFLYEVQSETALATWNTPRYPRRRFQSSDEVKTASQAELKELLKMNSKNVSMTFTRKDKSVLSKGLISKEDGFQQFH
ncbi:hypothetical protein TNCV_428611 [Trichonephila clavipes]|nr:hypothetical protein TNCV_428611 [Trichonephila clavipes]